MWPPWPRSGPRGTEPLFCGYALIHSLTKAKFLRSRRSGHRADCGSPRPDGKVGYSIEAAGFGSGNTGPARDRIEALVPPLLLSDNDMTLTDLEDDFMGSRN